MRVVKSADYELQSINLLGKLIWTEIIATNRRIVRICDYFDANIFTIRARDQA